MAKPVQAKQKPKSKRRWWHGILVLTMLAIASFFIVRSLLHKPPPIKVGILHSLTGTMAFNELNLVAASMLAIKEINESGGLLGREIKPVLVDGQSYWVTYAEEALRLIQGEEKVDVIFGCWTSTSRKMVKQIVEDNNHLLFYPVRYEGLEQSPNIIYTGATPNQQMIPGVKWCFDNLGKRFFVVATKEVYQIVAQELIKENIAFIGGEVVGTAEIEPDTKDVSDVIKQILAAKPDVILNMIEGETNIPFFKSLRGAGVTPERIPTMSFSITEPEFAKLGVENMIGDYATWNYFQSIQNHINEAFVADFKKETTPEKTLGDPIEAAYFGVHLWAQAVRNAQTTEVNTIRKALKGLSFNAPEGIVYIDENNNHTWKTVRIGKIRADGQFNVIWSSDKSIRPVPYPRYRTPEEWEKFVNFIYVYSRAPSEKELKEEQQGEQKTEEKEKQVKSEKANT